MSTNTDSGTTINFTGRTTTGAAGSYFTSDGSGTGFSLGQNTGVSLGGTGNIFLGYNAGQFNDGSGNVIEGLDANSHGVGPTTDSVIIGKNTGQVTSSRDNVFIGPDCALNTLTASEGVAIGARSFSDNTSGWYNVAIGADSFAKTGQSARSVALGAYAGRNLTTNNSVVVGFQAGLGSNTSLCEGLVIIGSQALYNISSVVNGLSIGSFSGYSVTTASDFLAVGTRAAYSVTTQSKVLSIGHGSAQNAQLVQDADVTLVGHSAGGRLVGGRALALGNRSAYNVDGSNVVCVGLDALNGRSSRRVSDSVAVGNSSGYDGTGSNVIYLGNLSGSGASGEGCVFIGNGAGINDTNSYKFILGATRTKAPLLIGNLDTANQPFLTVNGALRIQQGASEGPTPEDDGIVICKDDTSWQVFVDESDGLSVRKNGTPVVYFDDADDLAPNLDFTNQHRPAVTGAFEDMVNGGKTPQGIPLVGCLVSSTGQISSVPDKTGVVRRGKSGIRVSCALPVVELTTKRMDKACIGIFAGRENSMLPFASNGRKTRIYRSGGLNVIVPKSLDDERVIVNAGGEGGIYVVDTEGPIENGDYVCSSSIPGLAERQLDDLLHNYTVAKVTMDCSFDLASPEYNSVELFFEGRRHVASFVACVYTA